MAEMQRKPIFTAMQKADCRSNSGVAGGLKSMNMFFFEFTPPLNVGAMLIVWCSDFWKLLRGGQIAQVFYAQISRIFEVDTSNL